MTKFFKQALLLLVTINSFFTSKIHAQDAYGFKNVDASYFGTANNSSIHNDFQDVSINYNTGVGNINIPIYSISNGPLTLPISLFYSTQGIKADQVATDVGLGWNLAAGGNISRVIKGRPDEKWYLTNHASGSYSDWMKNNSFNLFLEKSYYSASYANWKKTCQVIGKANECNDYTTTWDLLGSFTTDVNHHVNNDIQPDLFTLNLPGKSINFVFDLNRNPILLDNSSNIKITFSSNSFTVLDENGIKYFFSSTDAEKIATYPSSYNQNIHLTGKNYINFDNGNLVSTGCGWTSPIYGFEINNIIDNWKLTKIETPDGKYSINFEYDNYNAQYISNASILYNINPATNTLEPPFSCIHTFGTLPETVGNYYDFNWVDKDAKRLKKILWKTGTLSNGQIIFESNTQRNDVETYSYDKSLDFIKIYDNQNNELKRFALSYSYFTSNVTTAETWELERNKRLKLNSITEYSSDLMAKPSYIFDYDPTPVPIKYTYEQDFWGYYNGNNTATMQGTLYHNPNYSNSNTSDFTLWSPFCIYPLNLPGSGGAAAYTTINGANRLPNINYTKAGILTKITYPTGGSLLMDFENNEFCADNDLTNRLAGGLRIKSTTIYDGINHANDIVKNYIYKLTGVNLPNSSVRSSGKINFLPSMGYYTRYRNNGAPLDFHKISAYNMASSTTSGESQVFYDEVKVVESGKGSTVYKYNNFGTFGHNNDLLFGGSPMITKLKTETGTWVNYGTMFTTAETQYRNTNHPYSPEPNIDWAVGELKEVLIYDEASVLKSKKTYNYLIKSFDKIHGYVTMPQFFLDNYTVSTAASKFNYLSVWKVLNDETEYLYDPANASISMSKTTNYEYTSTKHKFVTAMSSQNSKGAAYGGETFRTEYKYAADYEIFPSSTPTDIPTLAIRNMNVNTHELKAPIETTSWIIKNNQKYLIGGSINLYKDFNNTISQTPAPPIGYSDVITNNPSYNRINEQFVFENQTPLLINGYAPFGFGLQFGHTYSSKDSRYKRKIIYEKYDAFGNSTQVKKENGLRASTIYAYNNSIPVASVTNAMTTEIAHTSFEDVSNFSINSSRIISTDYYNGKKCYDMFPAINATTPNYDVGIDLSGANNQLNQNGKYTFSCWAKTGPGMAANKAYITIYTNDGVNLGNIFPTPNAFAYQSIAIPNSSTWQFFKVDIDLAKIRQASPTMPANQILSLRAFFVNNSTTDHFFVDEVRLNPSNSFMETSTYSPLIGVTSKTDAKNYSEFYEYDTFLRQKLVRDFNKNIISKTNYNYKP